MTPSSQRDRLPYRSLAGYLRGVFGSPLRKVAVDPGFGCPNRDGTVGTEGCAFCNPDSFVPDNARRGGDPVDQVQRIVGPGPSRPYIVYLQSGSATHAPPEELDRLFRRLMALPGAVGLFVGTRPDCVDRGVLDAFEPFRGRRLLWLEMGLQSASDATLERVRRGHRAEDFALARERAARRGIPVCAHVVLGLPGETPEDMVATADFLGGLRVEGVKVHHLQVVRGATLEADFARGEVPVLDVSAYLELVTAFLERLPPATVIHRLLADAPPSLLVAPLWPPRERVLEALRRRMVERRTFQGRLWRGGEG